MAEYYRLGVISDTHIGDVAIAAELAKQLLEGTFSEVDAILHAGDMILPELESCFDGIPFFSVQGNMDAARQNVPLKRIIELSDFRIGLMHGWGSPSSVPANVYSEFATDELDLLIFGHSHKPYLQHLGSTLLFNPGSATDHRDQADSCTVGLVELSDKISARHIPFQFDLTHMKLD